jgi:OHCU decarboxylase
MNPEAVGEPLADLAAGRAGGQARRLRWLNALPAEQASRELLACCGSTAWAARVAAARPFAGAAALAATAADVWDSLTPDDWLQAFAAHPRIGARAPVGGAGGPDRASGGPRPGPGASGGRRRPDPGASRADPGASWSRAEQARVGGADPGVLAALAAGNLAYERRFGHVFLIFASGRSAEDLLAALHQRLDNDPEVELRVAAAEQRKITALRLDKLLRQ